MLQVTRLAHVGLQAKSLSTQADALQLPNVDDIDRAHKDLLAAWGPGRHLFGNNLFSYPNRQPRVMAPYADQWRTASSR